MTNSRKIYHAAYNKAKYEANAEHYRQVSRDYYENNKALHIARVEASRKKRKNRNDGTSKKL